MNPSDLRVLRSKKMIKGAFLELIEEKGYKSATIKDIAERAMVNRKTFYNHYDSIDALFQEILHENICALVQASCQGSGENIRSDSLPCKIRSFLENLSLNKEVLRTLLNHVSVSVLNQQIEKCLHAHFMEQLAAAEDDIRSPRNEYPHQLISGLTTAFYMVIAQWWLTQDEYAEEQAATIVENMIKNGLAGAVII